MAWSSEFEFHLLDFDGTYIADVTNAFKRGFQRPLSSLGAGSLRIDPGTTAIATLLDTYLDGRYVRVLHDDVAVFVWRIEEPEAGGKREDDEHLIVAGRGWLSDFSDAIVLGWRGLNSIGSTDYRIMNFASPGYDDSGWSAPTSQGNGIAVGRRQLDVDDNIVPAPLGWEVDTAEWIANAADSTGVGRSYYRSSFTLASETTLVIVGTADNFYTWYLDGEALFGDRANERCWTQRRRIERTLPAGTYTVGCVVENTGGPSGCRFAAFTLDADGEPDTVVLQSQVTGWKVSSLPANEPGFTPGDVLATFHAETVAAESSNVVADWSLSFDADDDSNGDAWPIMPTWSCPIGATLADVLAQMHTEGWIDYEADYDAKVLNAWIAGNNAGSSGVTLVTAGTSVDDDGADIDLEDVKYPHVGRIKNRLVVKWSGGVVAVNNAASQSIHGVRTGYMTTDASNVAEAQRQGNRALDKLAAHAVVGQVIPVEGDTPGDIPLVDFTTRELVTLPDRDGDNAALRCEAITVELDDANDAPEFTVEWNARPRGGIEMRQADLLRTLGSALGEAPGSKNVTGLGAAVPRDTPILPSFPERGVSYSDLGDAADTIVGGGGGGDPVVQEVVFSFPGVLDDTDQTGWWPVPRDIEVVEVECVTTVAAALGVSLTNNVTTVWSDTLADNTNVQSDSVSIELAAGSRLRANTTDVDDANGENLTVVVRFVDSTAS